MLCTYRAPVQGDKERTRQDGKCSRKGLVRGADGTEAQMEQKAQWALAYDEGGFRYGIMTTNYSESFNCVFIGVRSLPVSGIIEFSFHKYNEYFVKRWKLV